jgi:hypothetical protein
MSYKFFTLENIFQDSELEYMNDHILKNYKSELRNEENIVIVNSSYGGHTDFAWEQLNKLTTIIEKITSKKVEPVNPYCRVYFNDAYLNRHIDRDNLEWTLTVCLGNNLSNDWPIFIEVDEKVIELPNKVGVCYLIEGTKIPHWRNKLICDENGYSTHMFLHWKNIEEESEYLKTGEDNFNYPF